MGLFYSGTLNSSPDENGIIWTASFKTNGRKGSTCKCHLARKFSSNVLEPEEAVVRTFKKRQLNKQICDMEIKKVAVVKEIIQAFNIRFFDIFGVEIRMNCVVMALIDTSHDEWCLIEDRCQTPFLYFIDRYGKPKVDNIQILQTLVHFSYHYTKGKLIISNLKGCRDSESITLSIPTIHSVSKCYGHKDDGLQGIEKCRELHSCNNDCMEFKQHVSETDVKYRERTPSAPYDPDLLLGLNMEETKECPEIGNCHGNEKIKVTGSREQNYRYDDEDKLPPYSPEDPYPIDGYQNWMISPSSATEPKQCRQFDDVFFSSDDVFR